MFVTPIETNVPLIRFILRGYKPLVYLTIFRTALIDGDLVSRSECALSINTKLSRKMLNSLSVFKMLLRVTIFPLGPWY